MAEERILVVDDEPDIIILCKRILEQEGYRIDTANNGMEALEKLKNNSYDMLLTDITMPGISGLETVQEAKKIDPEIVCVTMTAFGTMEIAIEALSLGVEEFAVKPFTRPSDLVRSIARALEKERLRKEVIRLKSLLPLFGLTETLLATVDPEEVYKELLTISSQETRADAAALYLWKHGKLSRTVCLDEESCRAWKSISQGVVLWVEENQKQFCMGKRHPENDDLFPEIKEQLGADALIITPLSTTGQFIGALALLKKNEPFEPGDGEFLSILAGQASISIENARLFSEISKAYDELKELDRMKSEFINIAAHELRTPLAIMTGYINVMEETASEQDRPFFEIITRNAGRLRALIEDMLSLRYLETGEAYVNVGKVSLYEVVENAITDLRLMAHKNQVGVINMIPPDYPIVLTDRQKMDLVVTNLLSNAIKYTPPDGEVTVRGWTDDTYAYVSVEDTGVGIPPDEFERIFERFYQVEDSLTREQGGIGLGLAIAKGMVGLCNGEIWVESEEGKGSTFTFKVPLKP